MKYVVRYEDNFDGGSIAEVYVDGKPVEYDTIEDFINAQAEEIASLQEVKAACQTAAEVQSETIGRRTNALRRIGEICSDGSVTAEVKLSSIRFIVKEALKPLSLFNFEKAAQAQSAEE